MIIYILQRVEARVRHGKPREPFYGNALGGLGATERCASRTGKHPRLQR